MTIPRELREAMQVEVRAAIEAGDSALDHVEADVRLFGDREDLGRRGSRQEKRQLGKRGHVVTAKAAGVAAGDGAANENKIETTLDAAPSWRHSGSHDT